MARLPRLVVAGQLHLVVQRGHGDAPVFRDDEDFASYRAALMESASALGVAIHAYALMPARVVLLATPGTPMALSRMLQAIGRRFGAGYNRRHQRSGVLWDGRFRATAVDAQAHFFDCMRHVEWAPVHAGLCSRPQEYPWSTAGHHVGLRADPAVIEHACFWGLGNTPFEREAHYRRLIEEPLPAATERQLAQAADKGWAVGDAAFLRALAELTTRRVAPLPRGRPRSASLVKKSVPK